MLPLRAVVALCALALSAACVSPRPDPEDPNMSPEGRAVMRLRHEIKEAFGVELRACTLLDGINTNTLKVDVRTDDKSLEERVATAQRMARFLAEKGALPPKHARVAFDFPVSFQLGCMPVNLYERVQLETAGFAVVQALPARRVLSYDNFIKGEMGKVVLDDTQWQLPFFVTVDSVELSREVMGVAAKEGEVFLSVHARWTNIGVNHATMSDDPWRLVEAAGARKGELVALLDGGSTHLARNGAHIKMPPVQPGQTQERWYVFRVRAEKLKSTPLAFARQRFAKRTVDEKAWTKAGFELWMPIKDSHAPALEPSEGHPLIARSADWRQLVAAP